ncbi:transposable element Tcb2 transposase [Trichonephila clavipes]|nr:transposable element Tcb2 transposase [Trichonephila clavipes]
MEFSIKTAVSLTRLSSTSSDFSVLNWSPRIQDINLMEHLYDVLEQGVKDCNTARKDLTELRTTLVNIWTVIPMKCLMKLAESMPRRAAAVIKIRGGLSRY